MRILMISPQPFFESRGTPCCIYQRIRALLMLGYEVDLITYHLGMDVNLSGLRIFRAPRLPFISSVKPGPSVAKIMLDTVVFFVALWRLFTSRGRYQYLHTHEEGALMGALLSAVFRCKHLYYMHSDLAELIAVSYDKIPLIVYIAKFAQKMMICRADAIVTCYPELETLCRRICPGKPIYTVFPSAVDCDRETMANEEDIAHLRHELQLGEGPILVYTGTITKYQGLDVLLQSVQGVCNTYPNAQYVIVGGKPEQVKELHMLAQQLGIAEHVVFVGSRPAEEMPLYMSIADILLSPRSKGTNTPLKLYTYLHSGKPILATSIVSHTQILTPDIALLVSPTPQGLTEGSLTLLRDHELAHRIGKNAYQEYSKCYSWSAFLERNRRVYYEFMPLAQ